MILSYVSCGGGIIPKMNSMIPHLTSLVVDLIKIGVPVLLIIWNARFRKSCNGTKRG